MKRASANFATHFRRFLLIFQFYSFIFSFFGFANPSLLEMRMQQEMADPGSGFSRASLQELRKYHIVFVDGVVNELAGLIPGRYGMGNYFSDNIQALDELVLTYDHVHFATRGTFVQNSYTLANKLLEISQRIKKPIILIGHSKGGSEVISTALTRPDFLISHLIEQVVSIQGPIGGSPLADRLAYNPLSRLVGIAMGKGLESLRPGVAQSLFKERFESFLEYLNLKFKNLDTPEWRANYLDISSRVIFVTSHRPTYQPLSWGVRAVLFFCTGGLDDNRPNDGLVYQDDQVLNSRFPFGHEVSLAADHIELVVAGGVSQSNSEKRRSFTWSLLQLLMERKIQSQVENEKDAIPKDPIS